MAKSGIRVKYKRGALDEAIRRIEGPIADAAQAAMTDAANAAKTEGRADIRAAGFSPRWANALRADVYPRPPRTSMGAAALIFHKIHYAGVFEEGPTTIGGKPLLWLPLKTTPKKVGGRKMTPAQYVRSIGPLFSLQKPGGPPLLAGQIAVNRRGQRSPGGRARVTLSALRRAGKGQASRLVPLFVGVDRVTLRDRFSITEITGKAADRLAAYYLRHLRPD